MSEAAGPYVDRHRKLIIVNSEAWGRPSSGELLALELEEARELGMLLLGACLDLEQVRGPMSGLDTSLEKRQIPSRRGNGGDDGRVD